MIPTVTASNTRMQQQQQQQSPPFNAYNSTINYYSTTNQQSLLNYHHHHHQLTPTRTTNHNNYNNNNNTNNTRLFLTNNDTTTNGCGASSVTTTPTILTTTPLHAFKLGSITHQSSPLLNGLLSSSSNLNNTKNCCDQNHVELNNKTQEDYDEEDNDDKPQVYQVEDNNYQLSCVQQQQQQQQQHQQIVHNDSTTIESPLSKTLKFNDRLNLSSPSSASVVNQNESFLSCQTKSSLKSTTTNTSGSVSSKEIKHVKFRTTNEHPPVADTPTFSRCSSLTSLNSFDAKSIQSSVASEYSRRPSGVMSPSDLPDSPDESFIIQRQQQQQLIQSRQQQNQQQQQQQQSFISIDQQSSRSNEITIVERTLLANASSINLLGNTTNSGNCSERSHFGGTESEYNREIQYNVENSPWIHQSERSSLSAITFNDDEYDNVDYKSNQRAAMQPTSTKGDYAAILSLLQTQSANNKAAKQQQHQQHQQQFSLTQQVNAYPFNSAASALTFTPPIKLSSTLNHQKSEHILVPSQLFQDDNKDDDDDEEDAPKVFCEQESASISPRSELSVPSLIKQEINKPKESFYGNPQFNLLFSKLNLNKENQQIAQQKQQQQLESNQEADLDEMPKVYETEAEDESVLQMTTIMPSNSSNRIQNGAKSIINTHPVILMKQQSLDTDSPKVFLVEDTPITCHSRYSSSNSLNEDDKKSSKYHENTTIVVGDLECDDKMNKSSSLLLSDSCHKPTNTPAGFVNMSRASYESLDDDDDEEDDEDEDEDDDEEEEDDENEDEEVEYCDEEEDANEKRIEDAKLNDNSKIFHKKTVLNHHLHNNSPVTTAITSSTSSTTTATSTISSKPETVNEVKPTTTTTTTTSVIANDATSTSNGNGCYEDDDLVLENFIKEMCPPQTSSRKSMTKVPIFNKRLNDSINSAQSPTVKKVDHSNHDQTNNRQQQQQQQKQVNLNASVTALTSTTETKLPKKRLSEDMTATSTTVTNGSKQIQHSRNHSFSMNQRPLFSTSKNSVQPAKKQQFSSLAQTSSTYSLSAITSSTCSTASTTNSVCVSSTHSTAAVAVAPIHHHPPAPIVNMTKTTQLRAKAAESKQNTNTNSNNLQRKTSVKTNNITKPTTTNTKTTTTAAKQPQQVSTTSSTTTTTSTTNHSDNKQKQTTNQHNKLNLPHQNHHHHHQQQQENIPTETGSLNRRKSFNIIPQASKLFKQSTTTTTATNNESKELTKTKSIDHISSNTATTFAKKALKQCKLNILNKASSSTTTTTATTTSSTTTNNKTSNQQLK